MGRRLTGPKDPLGAARRDHGRSAQELCQRLLRANFSRRALLSASLGAVGFSPLLAPAARAAAGFRVVHRGQSISLTLGGESLFTISPALFDGGPQIRCISRPDCLRIEVKGGRLPGTLVPADLVVAAERDGLT